MGNTIFLKSKTFIKSIFGKKEFFNVIDYILVLMSIFCSGYFFFTSDNTTPRTIFTCITCVAILIRFFASFDINYLSKIKKDKKQLIPLPTTICFILIGVSAIFSLFLNKEESYFISYFYFGILVISAFLLCRSISFDKFKTIFCKLMFAFSIVSITLFVAYKIAGFPVGLVQIGNKGNVFINSIFLNVQNIYYDRIQSIFWEPGVFASYILIALGFELLLDRKLCISHFLVFTLALIFTFSTAAYLLFFIIIFPFLIDKIRNKKAHFIIQFLFYPLLIILVVLVLKNIDLFTKLLPSVFSKISRQTASLTTRLYSPKINFTIFLEKPIFGWGIHGSNARYLELASAEQYNTSIDAQTSTSLGLMARFGVFGCIYTLMAFAGIIFYKKSRPLSIISFLILFLAIVNKEPHGNMLISWSLPFFFLYDAFDVEIIKKRNWQYDENGKLIIAEQRLVSDLLKENSHSGIVARNTVLSFCLKGLAILIGLFSVPVYSTYFGNDSTYGIWLTFLSVITWVMTFDLGFGNGMKNKLIVAISNNDKEEGKRIVSSTYSFSLLIGGIILVVGLLIISFLDVVKIFNFDPQFVSPNLVKIAFCITFSTIAIEFVLKNICHIFQAHQKHFLSNLLPLLANAGLLVFALIFRTSDYSTKLLYISIAYSIITLAPYILASFIAFLGPYKSIAPNAHFASISKSKSIVSLSLLFFLMQIALLFLNSVDQMVISSLFSSENVVLYTKYTKFFNTIFSISNIFNTIMWTSIRKSVFDKNTRQLKAGLRALLGFDIIMSFLCLTVMIFIQPLIDIWLGDNAFAVDQSIVIFVFVFTVLNIFVSSTGAVLNGFQCLLPRVISLISAAILKIGLIVLLRFYLVGVEWNIVIVVNCLIWIPLLVINIIFIVLSYKKWLKGVMA